MVTVLVVALGALVLFAGQATSVEFTRFVQAGEAQRDERLQDVLTVYYKDAGSWQGVQPVIEQMGQVSGARIVLSAPGGAVLADSFGPVGPAPFSQALVPGRPIEFQGQEVGEVRVIVSPGEPASTGAAIAHDALLLSAIPHAKVLTETFETKLGLPAMLPLPAEPGR